MTEAESRWGTRREAESRAEPSTACTAGSACRATTYVLWGEEMDSPRGRIQLMAGSRTGSR